jgi:glycosyltransferase involved in cell wall biosynthesis
MDRRVNSVAFVLPGIGAGGSEHVVSMLCNELAGRGLAVTLLAFVDRGTKPYYAHHDKVEVIHLGRPATRRGRLGQLISLLTRAFRLREALRRIQPDLVISFLTRTNIVTLLAARGIPVIVSERNNAALQQVGPLWSWLRRRLYPRAAALVTMTRGAMAQFADFAPPVQYVIPNHAVLPSRPHPRACEGRLVAVGRLVPQKGFDLLLDAFAKAGADHPNWNLTIWGEGPERAALEAQRERLGLTDRVHMPGLTRSPGAWVNEADLFVLSSRFEGWGLVVGEAMAAGIPTVAFDCDFGPSEMIDNAVNGVLVKNGDVSELARELERLFVDDKERRRLGEAGHEAMKQFTIPAVVSRWLDLITGNQLTASNDRPGQVATSRMTARR